MFRFDEKEFVAELDRKREQQFLKRVRDYDEKIAPSMRQKGYKRIDSIERTVVFTFGEITFSRNRWRKGKRTCYPVDEWLGLEKYIRYSPELIFHIAKHASVLSYREVCRTVKMAYRLEITKDAVLKSVKIAGRLFSERERYRLFKGDEQPRKIQADKIYLEGDGVLVKTTSSNDERRNTDLAHFLIHTGAKKVGNNRYVLENKHEIIHTSHEQAKEELIDYLYNHFEITDRTLLITNSDNGKGYSRRIFQEIKKALRIKRHEHFWDAYHVNEELKRFLKPYPSTLLNLAFKAIQNHNRGQLQTVLDTVESLIDSQESLDNFYNFRKKLLRNFCDTRSPKLRELSSRGIGVMESQHRKVTYRMKHRGMYWSIEGACTMSRMILIERIDKLYELFFGAWRQEYEEFRVTGLGAGFRINHRPHGAVIRKRGHK